LSLSNYLEDLCLNHVLTSSTAPFVTTTNIYVSLHTADPTESGTASPLASAGRFLVHFGVAASATSANDATASVVCSATGTITHVGLWDGSATATANHLWNGALTASKTVANVGDTVTLAIGALTVTLT
jgi:hypothetical protein